MGLFPWLQLHPSWRPVVTADDRDLAERQARDTAALLCELFGERLRGEPSLPCTWGDDAWHRAVSRLIALPGSRNLFRVLLAEEGGKS